jgi:hypothetical protein
VATIISHPDERHGPKDLQIVMTRSLKFYVDEVSPSLTGWAAFDAGSADPESGSLTLSMMLGQLRLGGLARTIDRPDCDTACGYVGAPKGFRVDVNAILAFAALNGTTASVEAEGENAAAIRHDLDFAVERSLLPWVDGNHGMRLVDTWFASARRLVLRMEGREHDWQPSAFQITGRGTGLPLSLPTSRFGGVALWSIEIELASAYRPILIIFSDGEGNIRSGEVIAFPSLARGGTHANETRLVGPGWEGVAALAQTSDRLAHALALRRSSPDQWQGRCRQIMFDPGQCRGSEPLFDADLVSTITDFFGVSFFLGSAAGKAEETTPTEIFRKILDSREDHEAPLAEGVSLALPADAVPTLRALIEPLQRDPTLSPAARSVPFIVMTDQESEAWLVAASHDHQPTVIANADHGLLAAQPMAIRVLPRETQLKGAGLFPLASDAPERERIERSGLPAPVSVIIPSARDGSPPVELLQSLAAQRGFETGELIYSATGVPAHDSAQPILETLFPGRHKTIIHSRPHARSDEFRSVAGYASHDSLLFLGSETVLHDPLTLLILVNDRLESGHAAMSCPLLHMHGDAATFAAAGYYLSGISFRGVPTLLFDLPDTRRLMPGIHRVVAAPLAAMSIDRHVACSAGAAAPAEILASSDEIMFGAAMLAKDYSNGMTTRVTALTRREDLRGAAVAAVFPLAPESSIVSRLIASAPGLQRL